MAGLPRLRVIANLGVGYDNVDLDAARRAGVAVTNTRDVMSGAFAELVVGLVLSCLRSILLADRYVRAGHWQGSEPSLLTRQPSWLTVGILGLGRIGRQWQIDCGPAIARFCIAARVP